MSKEPHALIPTYEPYKGRSAGQSEQGHKIRTCSSQQQQKKKKTVPQLQKTSGEAFTHFKFMCKTCGIC